MNTLRKLSIVTALFSSIMLLSAANSDTQLPELSVAKKQQHFDILFKNLNPEIIGKDYAEALAKKDTNAAIGAIAKYYRNRPVTVKYTDLGSRVNIASADQAIRGEMEQVNIPWNFPNGRINFLFDPTEIKGPRNYEWVWQLNRHRWWGNMGAVYIKTGDAKYAKSFNMQLRDWVTQTDIPKNWNGPGSAWRTIETGLRMMGAWPMAFEAFRRSPDFTDENLCLMLASMFRHGEHLMQNKTRGNWLLMEMNGANTFASIFPEFKNSQDIRIESFKILCNATQAQIFPDGMQYELSPDYHLVAANCAIGIYNNALQYNHLEELPDDFSKTLEMIANAYLNLATPSFTQPRTNDCFTMHTKQILAPALKIFPNREDFRWVTTNRQEGKAPEGEVASRFLPYAGFIAMRSSWEADATYMCFDVGPLGFAHVHQDKLNINLYKGGEELIFDDGGGQYEISDSRTYGISAANHNTVLVDGDGQNRTEPKVSTKPIDAKFVSTPTMDYAQAVYNQEFGAKKIKKASHTRTVRFFKPDFFCVVDDLKSTDGKKHTYELLFHLDTLKTKQVDKLPKALLSDYGKNYDVLILPLYPEELEVSTASGQKKPRMAGWFVGRNDNDLHPATTVFMKASSKSSHRFATLLIPVKRGEELPTLKRVDEKRFELTLRGNKQIIDLDKLDK